MVHVLGQVLFLLLYLWHLLCLDFLWVGPGLLLFALLLALSPAILYDVII
jgi:hypothetical protein